MLDRLRDRSIDANAELPCTKEVNVLGMVKGEERYIFLYDDDHRTAVLRMFGRYAADPQLSFTWYDAAVLCKRVRETAGL